MKILMFFILTVCVYAYSCKTPSPALQTIIPCTVDAAKEVSNTYIDNIKGNIALYTVMIKEQDTVFVVIYTLKDKTMRGGGAEITISKSDCRVIDLDFGQRNSS
ncbi:MAG: hypothetical protein R3E32_27280 [Chitinophagales bacterium]